MLGTVKGLLMVGERRRGTVRLDKEVKSDSDSVEEFHFSDKLKSFSLTNASSIGMFFVLKKIAGVG